jgi:IS30 family transposase
MKAIHKEKILELRSQGYSYDEISKELNCSKGTIAYHCGDGQKDKHRYRSNKFRKSNPVLHKIYRFYYADSRITKLSLSSKVKFQKMLYDKVLDFSRGNNSNKKGY